MTPPPLTPADLDRLEELAVAATPGPWGIGPYIAIDTGIWSKGEWPVATTWVDSEEEGITSTAARKRDDAAYIAACDPDTIRSLIAAARAGGELDAAWADAEAVLPEGWWFEVYPAPHKEGDVNPHTGTVLGPRPGPYVASAQPGWLPLDDEALVDSPEYSGPTPASALRALAAALRDRPA
jgi:hypothetical protein